MTFLLSKVLTKSLSTISLLVVSQLPKPILGLPIYTFLVIVDLKEQDAQEGGELGKSKIYAKLKPIL